MRCTNTSTFKEAEIQPHTEHICQRFKTKEKSQDSPSARICHTDIVTRVSTLAIKCKIVAFKVTIAMRVEENSPVYAQSHRKMVRQWIPTSGLSNLSKAQPSAATLSI